MRGKKSRAGYRGLDIEGWISRAGCGSKAAHSPRTHLGDLIKDLNAG
jgi:hypothetical protein